MLTRGHKKEQYNVAWTYYLTEGNIPGQFERQLVELFQLPCNLVTEPWSGYCRLVPYHTWRLVRLSSCLQPIYIRPVRETISGHKPGHKQVLSPMCIQVSMEIGARYLRPDQVAAEYDLLQARRQGNCSGDVNPTRKGHVTMMCLLLRGVQHMIM